MIVALLTGRGGIGSSFRGKNVFPVLGRALMSYSFEAARRSHLVEDIYLSTDGDELKAVAHGLGLKVIDRPVKLAQPDSRHVECIEHALDELSKRGVSVDILVVLLCNVAIHPDGQIDACVTALIEDPSLDSAVTVREWGDHHPLRARTTDANGLLKPIFDVDPNLPPARQLHEPAYYLDHQVWVIRTQGGRLPQPGFAPFPFLGRRTLGISNADIVIDVHNHEDIRYTETWLRSHGFTDVGHESRSPLH